MPTAPYQHCETVYNKMVEESKQEEYEGVPVTTWTGYTTKLFEQLGLAVPHYTNVLNKLQAMGCIYQIKRGGGRGENHSIWGLLTEPTRELFENSRDRPLGKDSKDDASEQRLRDINRRVGQVEDIVVTIEVKVDEFQKQIKELADTVEEYSARHNS